MLEDADIKPNLASLCEVTKEIRVLHVRKM